MVGMLSLFTALLRMNLFWVGEGKSDGNARYSLGPIVCFLCSNVISQSDPYDILFHSPESAIRLGQHFMQALGCVPADLTCARSKTLHHLRCPMIRRRDMDNHSSDSSPIHRWCLYPGKLFYNAQVELTQHRGQCDVDCHARGSGRFVWHIPEISAYKAERVYVFRFHHGHGIPVADIPGAYCVDISGRVCHATDIQVNFGPESVVPLVAQTGAMNGLRGK